MKRINKENEASVKGFIKLFFILCLVTIVLFFRAFIIDRVIVSGDSMNETFFDGDVCWVKKFGNESVGRFDVVIANMDGKTVIKRVIGLPGENIYVKDCHVYIDGALIDEAYDFFTDDGGVANKIYPIPEGEYFLMGDNRQQSFDSRDVGSVSLDQIKGVVVFRLYPFTRMNWF